MNSLVLRVDVVLIIGLLSLTVCSSITANKTEAACPDRMYRFEDHRCNWSVCLPLAPDIAMDTTSTEDAVYKESAINGTHPLLSTRAHERHLQALNAWYHSDQTGPKPINPADTVVATRSFYLSMSVFDTTLHVPTWLPPLGLQVDLQRTYLEQKRSESDGTMREIRVTPFMSGRGKEFVLSMVSFVAHDAVHGWFSMIEMDARHVSQDRVFWFRGKALSRDTTCGLECLEKDTTILLYDRIINSVDW